jgi:hypothetical protein
VIFARRRESPASGPVQVRERWRQVFESGEVVLQQFSSVELDAVTLEPESARPEGGLPYLLRLSSLLDQAAASTADMSELASAVAGLEASGFIRPGPPAPPEGQMPVEFAGLSAAADGTPPRRVALAGDLGLITYMRCRPLFVAEVYHAADPARPDRASAGWQLVARGFTPYDMPGCLIERPPARTARQAATGPHPPHVILREDRAAATMLGWLGGDVSAYLKLRAARATAPAAAATAPAATAPAATAPAATAPAATVPTATVAAGFSQLAELSLALPAGQEVMLRALAVGTGAAGHWLLTGEQLELATPVTLAQLGDRLDDMLATASRPGAAVLPG